MLCCDYHGGVPCGVAMILAQIILPFCYDFWVHGAKQSPEYLRSVPHPENEPYLPQHENLSPLADIELRQVTLNDVTTFATGLRPPVGGGRGPKSQRGRTGGKSRAVGAHVSQKCLPAGQGEYVHFPVRSWRMTMVMTVLTFIGAHGMTHCWSLSAMSILDSPYT